MKIKFADLWRSSGTIDRGTYALVGVLGFAIKHNFDRLVATYWFHRPWTLFNYWEPVRDVTRVTDLRDGEAVFLGTMVALALPFIWIGVALTLKRLRSAGFSPRLAVLFFVPFLNLLFFLLLCLVPERDVSLTPTKGDTRKSPRLMRILPESAVGSATISILLTVPIGLGLALLGSQLLRNYGWGLFVALPFAMGFAAATIYGVRQPRSLAVALELPAYRPDSWPRRCSR